MASSLLFHFSWDFRWAQWQLRQVSNYPARPRSPLALGFVSPSLPSPSCYPHCAFLCHVWRVCLAHLTLQILWQCWKKFLQFVTPNYHNNQTRTPFSMLPPNLLSLYLYLSVLIDSTPCWPGRLLYNCRNRCVCSSLCLPWEFALPSLSKQPPHSPFSLSPSHSCYTFIPTACNSFPFSVNFIQSAFVYLQYIYALNDGHPLVLLPPPTLPSPASTLQQKVSKCQSKDFNLSIVVRMRHKLMLSQSARVFAPLCHSAQWVKMSGLLGWRLIEIRWVEPGVQYVNVV